jgi:hypothetical protein
VVETSPSEFAWLTEAEWQAADQWQPMLNQVGTGASTRRLLLLAVALCRRIWDRLPDDDCRRMVEAVEVLVLEYLLAAEWHQVAAMSPRRWPFVY